MTQSQSAGRFGAGVSGRARRALSLQGRDPRLYRDPQANALADQYAEPLIVRQDRADGKPVRRLALDMGSVRELGSTVSGSYTQSEVQAIADKLDALIRQLRGD